MPSCTSLCVGTKEYLFGAGSGSRVKRASNLVPGANRWYNHLRLEPSNLYALAFSWTTLDQDLLLKAFIIIQIMYTFINPNLFISSFLHQTKIFCNRLYTACMFMPRFHVLISSCFVHNGVI